MSGVVEARKPGFGIRMARWGIPVIFGATQLFRRPPRPPGSVSTHRYGEHPDENLELIAPRGDVPERSPIIYVHGGGWIAGRKELYTRYLSFLAEAGHPIFNIEYPMAPENPHPGILRSLLKALDWIRENHGEIRGTCLMGDSAGGNLVMMLGLFSANPKLLDAVAPERGGVMPLACHCVVSLYGVLDRLSWIEDGFPGGEMMLESYGGKAAFEPEVGPALALTPMDLEFEAAPASFLAVGSEDQLCRSSKLFGERLAAGPGKVVYKEYPGEGHGFFNVGRTRCDAELRRDVLEFLDSIDSIDGGNRE